MKHSRLIVLGASIAALTSMAGPLAGPAAAGKAASGGVRVSVRVEGMRSTLLAKTVIATKAQTLDPDGKPADMCEGDTAAVALQDATKGRWTAGSYYSGLGYSVAGILGEAYPFSSAYYWSFWLDGKPATTGICGATLHPGARVLFFPQCSKEAAGECPDGLFNPAVLEIAAPARMRVGKSITLKVSSLDNLTGKPSPGVGVTLKAAGHTVTTGTSGTAHLRFTKAGTYRIVASASDSIRDELTVKVRR